MIWTNCLILKGNYWFGSINKMVNSLNSYMLMNDVSELIIHSKLQLSQTKEQKNFASVSLKATRY